jgi:hypothetical protein
MIHPTESNPNTLQTTADTMGLHVAYGRLEAYDHNYRQSLTPQQLLDYRVFNGELAERCPRCGTRYPEVKYDSFPDMVGTTFVETYTCCNLMDRVSDALEYRNGVAVDMA